MGLDSNVPLTELHDGPTVSIGGFRMRVEDLIVEERRLIQIPILSTEEVQVRIPVSEIPILVPWYMQLWHILNMDIRDFWRIYIRPLFRRP